MKQPVLGTTLRRAFDGIERFERSFITLFTLGVGLIILYEIIVRNLGFQGLKWIDELGRIMLVVTTLIGCSIAVKHRGHMIMDVLYTMVGDKSATLLRSLTYVISGGFYLYLAIYSVEWTMRLMRLGRTMQTIDLPAYLGWIGISFGIATMGLRYIVAAVRELVDPQAIGELKE